MPTRLLPFTGRLNLRATLRPITFSWGRWLSSGWVRPARTPEGPVTLQVSRDDTGIRGEAWGEGAAWILDRLEGWVGLGDDPESFVPEHPLIADLHRRHLGVRFARTGLVFESAVAAVLAQKVTGKEAVAGLRGLSVRFSHPAPGPFEGLMLPPDPDRLAAAPYHAYHDLGIEKRRADTVRRLAIDAVPIDRLAAATPAQTGVFLRRYTGVGGWTVAETVAVSHGDADALSVGDFHLKHLVAWHLTGQPRGTDEVMVELLEAFRPHRGRVVRLLELAGNYPRYGPRRQVRSFSGY
ncbi:MAG: DNA-3-methyladenine glycosylase 2 family protein [Acidimicrobiia bacterium]